MLKFLVDENIPEEFVNELKLRSDVISIRKMKIRNEKFSFSSKVINSIFPF